MSGQDRVVVSVRLPPPLMVRIAERLSGTAMNRTDLFEAALTQYLGADAGPLPPKARKEVVPAESKPPAKRVPAPAKKLAAEPVVAKVMAKPKDPLASRDKTLIGFDPITDEAIYR